MSAGHCHIFVLYYFKKAIFLPDNLCSLWQYGSISYTEILYLCCLRHSVQDTTFQICVKGEDNVQMMIGFLSNASFTADRFFCHCQSCLSI